MVDISERRTEERHTREQHSLDSGEQRTGRLRTGQALAGLLATDGLLHLYWATGLTWPAPDDRALSLAVLGGVVPFTPRVLLPLAALLFTAAAAVLARGLGRGGPRVRPLWGLVTLLVAAGLLVRGLVGLVWVFGVGDGAGGSAFYWLNLVLYTPVCLGFGVAAARLAGVWGGRSGRRVWVRRTALGLPLALTGLVLLGAYAYAPAEQRDRQVPYQDVVKSKYVETPVARFHYNQRGKGSPVVLLSPGASWTYAWQHQLETLSRTHTVYVVDLPGHGFTELRDDELGWDLGGMTTAIGSFLDAMELPEVALAGNSWSGGWALAYAQRHPERVSRLALLAPSGLDERDPVMWEALKLPVVGELLMNLGSGRSSAEASLRRTLVNDKDLVTDELVDTAWTPATFEDNRRAVYRLERGLDWSETEAALPETRQPVLLIWGKQDSTLPVSQAKRFAELLPDARVRELDGCGHGLTLDCAEPVSDLMEDFLRDSDR
ncbi:alpha/beta fold hydrolase [Streptomyces sp. E11-3]|uniref:alpha/beta fold hydrolase n=1 Tax=Streptomyces sp. E11-3 TaxID=3110112 RepID=UPI0039816281